MSDHKEASKQDIARQFDLPERQSKIAGLLKESDVYCICRSTDSTRFMIACDNCEEWYHGDCIGVTEQDAKYIKTYFCERCQEDNPALKTVYKSKKPPLQPANKERRNKEKDKEKEKDEEKEKDKDKDRSERRRVGRPRKNESKPIKESKHRRERKEEKIKLSQQQATPVKLPKRRTKRILTPTSSSEGEGDDNDQDMIQCYGPQCAKPARPRSKYCSDDCGIKLASARIYRVLPSRIHEWSLTPSVAEQRNRAELEEVRRKQYNCRKEIEELEARRKKLDEHIAHVQKLKIDPDDEELEPDDDGIMTCVTCGHEIPMKSCIKHMEKCYNKHESQTSFASVAKTNVDGIPIFCDFYNPGNKTYCKRLKVLCPEHSREPKMKDNEICGCPLIKSVCQESGEHCRLAKKKCNRHFGWEKLQRAEIDQERVRQWLKYDELLEAERTLRQALTNRAGVLGLLLHSSFDYDAALPGVIQPS